MTMPPWDRRTSTTPSLPFALGACRTPTPDPDTTPGTCLHPTLCCALATGPLLASHVDLCRVWGSYLVKRQCLDLDPVISDWEMSLAQLVDCAHLWM
jgi:hypothetical protein